MTQTLILSLLVNQLLAELHLYVPEILHAYLSEALARLVLSLALGYLLSRTLVAPGLAWDDEREIGRLLEVLQRGASGREV